MNKIFSRVWSKALGRVVVASELASGDAAPGYPVRAVCGFSRPLRACALGIMLVLGIGWQAQANTITVNGDCATGGSGTPGRIPAPSTSSQATDGSGTYSTVAGCNASGNGQMAATVYGTLSQATGPGATAIGFNAASAQWGTSLGLESRATGRAGTALGFGSQATALNAVAIGGAGGDGTTPLPEAASTIASGAHSIAIGANSVRGAQAAGANAIAIGGEASAQTGSSVAIGSGATVNGSGATAGGVAIGSMAIASVASATALGAGAQAQGTNSISIGANRGTPSVASGDGSQAIGNLANATGVSALAYGRQSAASGSGAVAMGQGAQANADGSVAIGGSTEGFDGAGAAQADGLLAVAVGNQSQAIGDSSIALGAGAQATGESSISIGTGNVVTGDRSGAIGDPSYIDADDSYAIGNNNSIDAASTEAFILGNNVTLTDVPNAVALGANTSVTVADGVALGAGSVANTAAGVAGYVPTGADAAQTAAINATTSTLGAVSVGDAANGQYRQITGVAAGTEDSDAVNVAQLVAAQEAATTHYYSVNDNGVVGGNYDNDGAQGNNSMAAGIRAAVAAAATNGTAVGTDSSVTAVGGTAIGYSSSAAGQYAIAIGDSAATGTDAIAMGRASNSVASGVAIGYTARAVGANGVAIGRFSTASNNGIALGTSADANQAGSIAIGETAYAGVDAIHIGHSTVNGNRSNHTGAFRRGSTLIGDNANAQGLYSTVVGNGNNLLVNQNIQATGLLGQQFVAQGAFSNIYGAYNTVGERGTSTTDTTTNNRTFSGVAVTVTGSANEVQDSNGAFVAGYGNTVTNSYDDQINTSGILESINADAIAALIRNDATKLGQVGVIGAANRLDNGNNVLLMGMRSNVSDASMSSVHGFNNQASGISNSSISGADLVVENADRVFVAGNNSEVQNATGVLAMGSNQVLGSASTNVSNSILLGDNIEFATSVDGEDAIAIGNDTRVANGAVAVGVTAQALGERSIAVGYDAIATGSVAMGASSRAGNGGAAFGDSAVATYLGGSTVAGTVAGAALGQNASADVSGAVALGTNSSVTAENSVALGSESVADGSTLANAAYSPTGNVNDVAGIAPVGEVSIGSAGSERRITNVAAGANDTDAVNVSQLRAVEGMASAGWNVTDADGNAANIGPDGTVTFEGDGNITVTQTGTDDDGVVEVALNRDLDVDSVTAGDTTIDTNGVAVGADVMLGNTGLTVVGGTTTTVVNGDGLTTGAVVVSGVSNDVTGLSNTTLDAADFATAGRAATEEQLQLVRDEMIDANGARYYSVNSTGGGNEDNDGATGEDAIAAGKDAEAEGDEAVAIGFGSLAAGDGSLALGAGAQAGELNSLALGAGAMANHANSIALGAGSATTVGAQAGYEGAYVGASSSSGEVNVGERQITGVAAGSADTDAVNVSQLQGGVVHAINVSNEYTDTQIGAINTRIDEIDGRVTSIEGDIVDIRGDITDLGDRVTNVEGDIGDLAVTVNAFDNRVTNLENGASGPFQVVQDEDYTPPAPTGANAAAGGSGAVASGDNSTAVGNQAVASGINSTAIGQGATASHDNSVALGQGSATTVGAQSGYDAAYVGTSSSTGEVNVGGRTVSGVAPGIAPTDAVNVSQLNAGIEHAITEANAYTDNRINQLYDDVWYANETLRRDMYSAVATAMAVKQAPWAPGKTTYYAGVAAYKNQGAVGLSLRRTADNGRWSLEGGFSKNRDGSGVYMGVSGVLGN